MKEKFKNLSAPVGIVLSIVAVILFTIKSCICLLYYMSLTVNFFVYARFNVVSANRW